jgi:SulP family sulfate permease
MADPVSLHPRHGPAWPIARWWRLVSRRTLRDDALAGLTGAVIVLPQAVAFATIAGLPPEYGLYAAMVPTAVAALFGSSWHLVSGPTTAISIVVFAAVDPLARPGSPEFLGLVLTLTFLAGAFQLAMGLARLGALVNFISHTVIVGFTAGAALLIAASQVRNFFGVDIPRGAHFHEVLIHLGGHLPDLDPQVTAVAVTTLVSGALVRHFLPRVPYLIVAMLVGSLVAAGLNAGLGGPAATGIATVGALAGHLPPLSLPDFSARAIQDLAFPGLIVAILGLTEAVAIARSVALRSGQAIDANQEFIGQGLANLAGSFFSAYAASGSFNRSGVSYTAGARTPLAAVLSAVFLLGIVVVVGPLAAYLPVATMAGVLFLVAWGLIDVHHIGEILRVHRGEAVVLLTSFVGTLIDLEKGLFLGIIVSLVFYLYRTSHPSIRAFAPNPAEPGNPRRKFVPVTEGVPECPQMKIVRVEGSVFFGAVDHVERTLRGIDEADPSLKNVMLLSRAVNFVDLAGAEMLTREAARRRRLGGNLYLCGVQKGFCDMLTGGGYLGEVGRENIFASKGQAIQAIYARLDPEVCRACPTRVFHECRERLPNGEPRAARPLNHGEFA